MNEMSFNILKLLYMILCISHFKIKRHETKTIRFEINLSSKK